VPANGSDRVATGVVDVDGDGVLLAAGREVVLLAAVPDVPVLL
jgi:hypothetical protein